MRIENITSFTNPKIKTLICLGEKSKTRREMGLFVVEGMREVKRAIASGFIPKSIFICDTIIDKEQWKGLEYQLDNNCSVFNISNKIYDRIAYRGGTEGIIAEFRTKNLSLSDIKLSKNPLVVILEDVEKPGNLGAVLRSTDAVGADALIVTSPLTDLYNPNIIRSSLGAVFSRQIAISNNEDCIKWLKDNNIQILTAQLQDSQVYYHSNMTKATAIVLGSEAKGLSKIWREAADRHILIPMLGICDSLNVSVSAAILLYEAIRQRQDKNTEQ